MSTFKRILLYLVMAISIIMLLAGLAGIIGVWSVNTPVTDTILEVLAPINSALQQVESAAYESATALTEVSAALEEADAQVRELGAEIIKGSIVLEIVSEIIGEDVRPSIKKAIDNIRAVYDTLVAIERAIGAFNAIPFISFELPGSKEVARVRAGMEETSIEVEYLLEESQQKKESTVAEAVDWVTEPIGQINDQLEEMTVEVSGFGASAGEVSDDLTYVQSQIPGLIDALSTVASLVLAWFVFSQVAVFVLCLKYLQGRIL